MTNGAPYPYEPPPGEGRRHTTPGPGGTARRRSPARMLLPLAVAGWALLEIWLLTLVADAAGGLTVLLLLLGGLVLGALVVRRAGRRAWRQLSSTLSSAAGPEPTDADALGRGRGGHTLAMLGGLLLMVPGLLSDAVALLCLFPPTAGLLRRAAERRLARGGLGEAVRQARTAQDQVRIHRPGGRVVEGEVIRDDDGPGGAAPR